MKQHVGSFFCAGLVAIVMIVFGTGSTVLAADGTLTILATSDIHSTLMPTGAYVDGEYTSGGFLRLAERIIELKTASLYAGHQVLVLDGGDNVAGTYFHYAYKGVAEMALMGGLYDATTLGNHEFDWTPTAMAGAMQALLAQGGTPPVYVSSNLVDWGGSPLQGFWGSYIVPYIVKDLSGMKVGIFGLMTKGTAALGQSSPLVFSDLSTQEGITAALGVAMTLQQGMGCDVIVLLAHNGLNYDMGLAGYAAAFGVKLDVIISGHDHIANPSIVKYGNTHIMQLGAYTEYLGRLTMTVQNKQITGYSFNLEGINNSNPDINGEPTFGGVNPAPTAWATLVGTYNMFANPAAMAYQIGQAYPTGWGEATTEAGTWGDFSGGSEQDAMGVSYIWQMYSMLDAFNQMKTTLFHATPPYGDETADSWYQIPAVTQISLVKNDYAEHNLGDLISDSMFLRGALVDLGDPNAAVKGLPGTPNDDVTDFAVEANGTIRSDIHLDENGITTSDAYQVLPLGIGLKSFDIVNGELPVDGEGNPMLAPGFDLMRFYMLGADLKKAMELGASADTLGEMFFLNWSGLTFDYDRSKDLGERVSNAKVANYDIIDTAYYKGTTSTYVGSSFLLLPVLLQSAVNAGALTESQYEYFSSMKIYLNRQGTQITDIMGTLALTYCGKQWLAFADKIMWPWWYGGMNGIISSYFYGSPGHRMNDITPSTYHIDVTAKKFQVTAPTVITRLNGRKAGEPGFLAAYDLNRDGIINQADLSIALSAVR